MEGFAGEYRRNVGELDRDIGDVVLKPLSEITGQVVDAETGKPIERFSVRISLNDIYRRVEDQEIGTAEGLFQLGGLQPGRDVTLTIRAHGYETTVFDSIAVPTKKAAPPVYELRVGSQSLLGVVLDEEGRAVPKAEVTLIIYSQTGRQRSDFSWGFLPGVNVDALLFESLLTDSEGKFSFDGLPAWPESAGKPISIYPYQVDILAHKSGYSKTRITELEVMEPEEWKNLAVEVASGETLTVDVDLALLPNARNVHLHRKDRLGIQGSESETQRLSDGSTQVTFENLKPGDYVLVLSTELPTVSRSVQKAVAEVTVKRGETATARIPQAPSATLRGRVTVGGKAIKRGTLSLSRDLFGISFVTSVRLNSNGEYSYDYIQPGSYAASANMGGGVSTPSASPYDLTVDISEGENVRDLEFKPAAQVDANTAQTVAFTGSIKGQVVDAETGKPIKRFSIRKEIRGDYNHAKSQEVSSDDGVFQLGELGSGREGKLGISGTVY